MKVLGGGNERFVTCTIHVQENGVKENGVRDTFVNVGEVSLTPFFEMIISPPKEAHAYPN